MTESTKVGHVNMEKLPIILSLLYHNFNTIYTNTMKCSLLMQNSEGILQLFMEMRYYTYIELKVLAKYNIL